MYKYYRIETIICEKYCIISVICSSAFLYRRMEEVLWFVKTLQSVSLPLVTQKSAIVMNDLQFI